MVKLSEEQKVKLSEVILSHKRNMFQNSAFCHVEDEAVTALFFQAKIRSLSLDVEEPISSLKMGEVFSELVNERNLHMQFFSFPEDCWGAMHQMEAEKMFSVIPDGDEGVSFVINKDSTLGQVIGEELEKIAGEL